MVSHVVTCTPQPPPAKRDVHVSNEDLYNIIMSSDLEEETKLAYVASMRCLVQGGPGCRGRPPTPPLVEGGCTIVGLLKRPEETCQLIKQMLQARGIGNIPASMQNYTVPLMATLARHPDFAQKAELRLRWKDALQTHAITPISERYRENKPTERQIQGFVSYPEIQAAFKQLCMEKPGSLESLVVGLIAQAEEGFWPQRQDYGAVRIYEGTETPKVGPKDNYMCIYQEAGQVRGFICLQSYKTAKAYGPCRLPLCALYIHTLLASLDQEQACTTIRRSWLFTKALGPRDKPFDKANSFGRMASKVLQNVFDGRKLTLSGARHSCVSWLHASQYWMSISDAERAAIAQKMSHSYQTAMRYRFATRYIPAE